MVHDLEVPLPLPGLQIDTDQTFAKQVVPRSVPAVKVRGRRLHSQVDQPEFFIDGDLGPDARVAIGGPRIVKPGVIAKLAGAGDRMKSPQLFARPRVEG